MQRIAAFAVIRGQGECQAMMDGVVNKEIQEQNRRIRAAREELKSTQSHRNRLLADRLKAVRASTAPKHYPRWLRRMGEQIALIWAILCMLAQEAGMIELPSAGETRQRLD